MPEQPLVALGLSVILAPSPAWEMIPSGQAPHAPWDAHASWAEDPVPAGETGPSHLPAHRDGSTAFSTRY